MVTNVSMALSEFPKFLSETFKNKSIMQKNKYRYKGIHDPFDDDDDAAYYDLVKVQIYQIF